MSMMRIPRSLPLIFAAALVAGPASLSAQEAAPDMAAAAATSPDAPAAGSQPPPPEVPAEILEQLNNMAEQSRSAMGQVNELLKQDLSAIANADAIFDTMIQAIRDAAAQGAPESEFVKTLEELAKQARLDAAEAKAGDDQDAVTYFLAAADGFERSKDEAVAFYTNSFRNIRDIERDKKLFVRSMKRKHYELAKSHVAEGLAVLEALDADILQVRKSLPDYQVESQ